MDGNGVDKEQWGQVIMKRVDVAEGLWWIQVVLLREGCDGGLITVGYEEGEMQLYWHKITSFAFV